MPQETKYNLVRLQTIIDRDLCTIDLVNYTNARGKSTIVFTCACGNQHQKSFQHLYERSAFCNDCIKKKEVINRNASNLNKYGVENTFQIPEFIEKAKQTNILRYGTEHVLQNPEIKERVKQTMMEKYGVENISQLEETKEKTKQTNLLKYGVEYISQVLIFKEKTKQTNLVRYGTKSPIQNQEVKEKFKKTNLERYGVEYPNQNPEMCEKYQIAAYKYKDYTLPNGDIIKVQGYEPVAFDILFSLGYDQDDMITSKADVPEIWYYNEEKKHRYYCDIYIISLNKIIEIKSEWTYEVNKEKNRLKAEACIKDGYEFEFWIIGRDKSYRIINPSILNN